MLRRPTLSLRMLLLQEPVEETGQPMDEGNAKVLIAAKTDVPVTILAPNREIPRQ